MATGQSKSPVGNTVPNGAFQRRMKSKEIHAIARGPQGKPSFMKRQQQQRIIIMDVAAAGWYVDLEDITISRKFRVNENYSSILFQFLCQKQKSLFVQLLRKGFFIETPCRVSETISAQIK